MSPSKKEKKDPKKERWFFKINTSLVGLLIKLLLLCVERITATSRRQFSFETNLLFIFPKIYGWCVCNSLRVTSNDESVLKEKQLVPISRFDTSYKRVMIVCNIISSTFFLPMGGLVSLFFPFIIITVLYIQRIARMKI